MTLKEFQDLNIQEGDKVMITYKTPISPNPVKTLLTINLILIDGNSFTLKSLRSNF